MLLRRIWPLFPSVTFRNAVALMLLAPVAATLYAASISKGTKITVRIERTMNSDRGTRAGDSFDAVLVREIRSGQLVAAPAGSRVRGTVVSVSDSAGGTHAGSISLRIDSIETASATQLIDTDTYTQRGHPPAGTSDRDRNAQATAKIADIVRDIGKPKIETAGDPNVKLEAGGPVAIVARDMTITFKLRAPSREIPH
jgi:hypothetical protein